MHPWRSVKVGLVHIRSIHSFVYQVWWILEICFRYPPPPPQGTEVSQAFIITEGAGKVGGNIVKAPS
jgi:hypothetical protein